MQNNNKKIDNSSFLGTGYTKSNQNSFFLKFNKKKKTLLVGTIQTIKKIVSHINFKFQHKLDVDWLSIATLFVLGYALLRSGSFLIFYLIIWNIFPLSQYYIIYNPVSFEIYLLLLSFFIAWYSLRLLYSFPKEFQIHLWIFHRLILDNLDYFSKRYVGKNYKMLEHFWILIFLVFVCLCPKYGLFLIWIGTICIELYCLDNLRKPQNLLFIPSWIKFLDDDLDATTSELAESDDILPEEDFSMVTISPMWTLWEYEEDISEPQHEPNTDFTVEDFETFFAEHTFIPPLVIDLYEDEFKDGWVNWFWLNLFYKILPILCFINIIICVLFFIWGIPEYFYLDMQICDVIIQDFLLEYQRMLLVYTDTQWSSSWKWLMGGLGFRFYFKKYGGFFFNVSNDIAADNLLNDYKKYVKYTYYLNHDISRQGKIYSYIFPYYYQYTQIKYFFTKMQDFTTPLRETYLHKYFFYDDLYLYQQLKEFIPIMRSKRSPNRKKEQEILSWLFYKSKTWSKDYYYTAPAVHVFPEKHFFWLDFLRLLFVVQELDIMPHSTFFNKRKWFDEDVFDTDSESEQHFLEEYLFDFGDRELWLDYDAYELDSELTTLLKHGTPAPSLYTYFAEAHPIIDPSIFIVLNPVFYLNGLTGKINPAPEYFTQESFDLEAMRFGKFSYIGPDVELEKIKEKDLKEYNEWFDPKHINMYGAEAKDFDWNLEIEEQEENFKANRWPTSDYEILFSYYHQANLDILPDLLQDMDPVQLQNKTFFSYVLRNDSSQYPNRRRTFLYDRMLQTFTYAANVQREDRYNIADLFDLIETTPDGQLGQSYDFLMLYGMGEQTYGTSDIYTKYVKGYDSKSTRTELFQNLTDVNWYKYYYKVDTIMNYYDYMPSYRKFFMKTWPLEYVDTPYNFFGKINTITTSDTAVYTTDGWIIYIPEHTDLLFYQSINTLSDFSMVLF